MAKRINPFSEAEQIGKLVVSDYVRLALSEGVNPWEAYREMKRKLSRIKKENMIHYEAPND